MSTTYRRSNRSFWSRNTSAPTNIVSPTNLPVTVPTDFMGMCYMQYPVSNISANGMISWGSNRMCQTSGCRWYQIELTQGVYDATALTNLDSLITYQRTNGATVNMGLYGTPTFYASSSAHPTYADNVTYGPWGGIGECANPTSLAAVSNFCSMIISRYNLPGGAWYDIYGASLGKGIQYWETWNEPSSGQDSNGAATISATTLTNGVYYRIVSAGTTNFTLIGAANSNVGTYFWATGTNTGTGTGTVEQMRGTGFWWGSEVQLVDLCYTQYSTIKALDSSVKVTTPGFSSYTAGGPFLNTNSSITGLPGSHYCDTFCFHPYGHNPPGVVYDGDIDDIIFGSNGIAVVRNTLRNVGLPNMPISINEWGIASAGSPPTQFQLDWYAATAAFRYTWMCKFFMACAAYGVQSVHPWHWQETGATGNSGNWQQDVNGVQKAYNDLAAYLPGKTITSASFHVPGDASLTFSDSSTWTISSTNTTTTQSISFSAISDHIITDSPFSVSPSSSSGLSVNLTSITPDICTISGNTVTIKDIGICSLSSTQAGNSSYSAAARVIQNFNVLPSPS